jgi:hypothetical protein
MEIPQYPDSRSLELTDKPLLDRLFSETQPRISELTFAGLYLFRNAHQYQISAIAGSLVILGKGYDGKSYFLPPLGGDCSQTAQVLFADGLPLYGADDQWISGYLAGMDVQMADLRDSSDYIYLRDELATLPGSRYHKKKNRINYYTLRHEYSGALFSTNDLEGCLELVDIWFRSFRNDAAESLFLEIEATREALRSAPVLGLEGVVIRVEGKVVAFALGERLNRNTAVCHFEKADPFAEGLYQLVNREFARLLFPDCTFINREQDLGDMGLRNAKLSYHPVELLKKYLVTRVDHKDFVALLEKTL